MWYDAFVILDGEDFILSVLNPFCFMSKVSNKSRKARKLRAPSEKERENKLAGEHATIQKANISLTRSPDGKEDINILAQR